MYMDTNIIYSTYIYRHTSIQIHLYIHKHANIHRNAFIYTLIPIAIADSLVHTTKGRKYHHGNFVDNKWVYDDDGRTLPVASPLSTVVDRSGYDLDLDFTSDVFIGANGGKRKLETDFILNIQVCDSNSIVYYSLIYILYICYVF